jgi:prevent-host-death family protein
MKTVGSFAAKTHLSSLLDQVRRGESFLITKRGKPVAALSPIRTAGLHACQDGIGEFRKRFARSLRAFSLDEIAELRNQGRR